jgi:site-specific DNA recombinase
VLRSGATQAIARAKRWFEDVASGRVPSPTEIARRERLAKRYFARRTKLAFVAPSIVEAVVEGRAPADSRMTLSLT